MGFLDKLKLSHKKDELDIPPPPPVDKKPISAKDTTLPSDDLPPLPSDLTMPANEEPLKAPSTPDQKVSAEPKAAPMAAPNPVPPSAPTPEHPEPVAITPKKATRQDMREAFGDIPPIKVTAQQKGFITDDHVKELDVDNFVLPGEKAVEAPANPTPTGPAPQGYEGPLYVDVKTYEDIQQTLKDLQKQLKEVGGDVDSIKRLTKDEDKQFAILVKKLERIQDDVLRVDKDLFERK